MAVNEKGSRNITVDGIRFKWRATGNDDGISIAVWPVDNPSSKVVAGIDYHHDMKQIGEGVWTSLGQLVVTNRLIRELILHVGVEKILSNHGQVNIGRVEKFYDVSNAIRGSLDT